jgi:hypothetical protein
MPAVIPSYQEMSGRADFATLPDADAYTKIAGTMKSVDFDGKNYMISHNKSAGFYVLQNTATFLDDSASKQAQGWIDDEWKIHASLARVAAVPDMADASQVTGNIEKAWDAAVPILMKYGVNQAKFIDADHAVAGFKNEARNPDPEQSKKTLTIYYGPHDHLNPDMWSKMLSEIETAWQKAGVKSGDEIKGDKPIAESAYFHSSRGRKEGKRVSASDRNDDFLNNGPFDDVVISAEQKGGFLGDILNRKTQPSRPRQI